MTNGEHYEYLCGIVAKAAKVLTEDELRDLCSALGIHPNEVKS